MRAAPVLNPVLGAALVVFAALLALFPLTSTDLWWHLAAGRWMVEHGALPLADPFGAITSGRPWADAHWLFQLAAFALYRLGGLGAVIAAKAALVGLGAWLLLRIAERHGPTPRWLVVPALALALLPLRELLLARPVIPTLLILAAFLLVLEDHAAGGRPRRLGWLIPLQLVWVNLQPLWPLGLVMVGAYLGGGALARLDRGAPRRPLRPLVLVLGGLLVASSLTPLGLEGLMRPLHLFGRIDPAADALFSLNVSENVPTWHLGLSGLGAALLWLSVASFGTFLIPGRRLRFDRLLVVSAFLVPALMANRNVLPFAWVAVPLALANVGGWRLLRGEPNRGVQRLAPGLSLALLALLMVPLGRGLAAQGPIDRPGPFRIPLRSAALLEDLAFEGSVFSSVRFGSHLTFALPLARPTIDGRLILQTSGEFAEHLGVVDHPETFSAYADRVGVGAVVLPVFAPERYRRLAAHLTGDPGWKTVLVDGFEVLFLRADDPRGPAVDLDDLPGLRRSLDAHWGGHPPAENARARRGLAELLAQAGRPRQARELLAGLDDAAARSLAARCLYLEGRLDEARSAAAALLEAYPGDLETLGLLALIASETGDADSALAWAERALALDPRDPLARRVVSQLGHRP